MCRTVRLRYGQTPANRAYLPDMNQRGCEYCLDDRNMKFGHVEQIASSEQRGLLLRCPQCGWLYVDPSDGVSEPIRIALDDAANSFDIPI